MKRKYESFTLSNNDLYTLGISDFHNANKLPFLKNHDYYSVKYLLKYYKKNEFFPGLRKVIDEWRVYFCLLEAISIYNRTDTFVKKIVILENNKILLQFLSNDEKLFMTKRECLNDPKIFLL